MHSEKNSAKNFSEYSKLKIYASTSDKIDGKLLYEHIVHRAKDEVVSGVTVYRGVMGFGMSSKISTSKFWELTEKLPIVIEMVDTTEKLKVFYRMIELDLQQMSKGCLATMSPIDVLLQQKGQ